MQSDDTSLNLFNEEIMELESDLEAMLETPVVDGTGLADTYDLKLTWQTSSPDEAKNSSIKRALLEQFGLELVSTNMPVEMLVVEKAK